MTATDSFRILVADDPTMPSPCGAWRRRRLSAGARRPHIWLTWDPRAVAVAVIAGRTDGPGRVRLRQAGYRCVAVVPAADIWLRQRGVTDRGLPTTRHPQTHATRP